jgi:hypothetical protein
MCWLQFGDEQNGATVALGNDRREAVVVRRGTGMLVVGTKGELVVACLSCSCPPLIQGHVQGWLG